MDYRIAALETRLREVGIGAAAIGALAGFSAGSCTNNCTAACTIGCTNGCTGKSCTEPEVGTIATIQPATPALERAREGMEAFRKATER